MSVKPAAAPKLVITAGQRHPRSLHCPFPAAAAARPVVRRTSRAFTAHARRAVVCAAEVSQPTSSGRHEEQPPPELSVELPTADVQASVSIMGVRQGRGAAILVARVDPGSAAASAGVRVGQQLLGVSDPIRRTEMWELNAQASLRYTRQAICMRVADTITLRLTAQQAPEWQDVVAAKRAEAAEAAAGGVTQQQQVEQQRQAQADEAAADGGLSMEVPDDLLSAIVQAVELERSGSFDEAAPRSPSSPPGSGASANGSNGAPVTVAQRLEAQYAAAQGGEGQAVQRQMTDLERRQKKRKEYFEQTSKRNDGPFFAAVAALFVIPPAIILAVAYASGYLASLDSFALMR